MTMAVCCKAQLQKQAALGIIPMTIYAKLLSLANVTDAVYRTIRYCRTKLQITHSMDAYESDNSYFIQEVGCGGSVTNNRV